MGEQQPTLPQQLRSRACPAGLPHTGTEPEEDHGHTDCWLLHQAADTIEALEQLVEEDEGVIKVLRRHRDTAETRLEAINDVIGDPQHMLDILDHMSDINKTLNIQGLQAWAVSQLRNITLAATTR